GNPLQEEWITRHLPDLRVPVSIGVGGLFDHWAGNLVRAPHWIRRAGFEWLQILLQQPRKKWRRYMLGNPKFIARALAAARTERIAPPGAASTGLSRRHGRALAHEEVDAPGVRAGRTRRVRLVAIRHEGRPPRCTRPHLPRHRQGAAQPLRRGLHELRDTSALDCRVGPRALPRELHGVPRGGIGCAAWRAPGDARRR